MIDTLVDLHRVDPAEVGLADFGRPRGFLERQVRRWKKQLDASHSRDLDGAAELHALLEANVPPESAPAIVHGDYRLDNLLVGADDRVAAVLAKHAVRPQQLTLEITEDALLGDLPTARTVTARLRRIGALLSLDDFGTGYSSLSYLKRFPIDVLKIDRSFVSGIGGSEDDGAIAGAVISMGSSLKFRVVAEGVEDRNQLAFLRERRCDEAQGYLFSRPVEARAFERLLDSRPADWRLALA